MQVDEVIEIGEPNNASVNGRIIYESSAKSRFMWQKLWDAGRWSWLIEAKKLFGFTSRSEECECGAADKQQRTCHNARVVWQLTNVSFRDDDC